MTPLDVTDLTKISDELETAHPSAILGWAAETFGDTLAVVTSFQPTGIVTLHMLADIAPRTPVLTLDTGLLFPETYELMDELEQRFHLNLIRVRPEQNVEEQAEAYGPALWERDPNQCCNLRKVIPLDTSLAEYDAWVTGLRRDQSERRSATPVVSWDKKREMVKLCPFAAWTEAMVWAHVEEYALPYNRLHDQNYPSIGCWPCTQAVAPDTTDQRAGRWANRDKSECGIHVGNL
jgi:phosphoadenosine phosphosulfate reductase